MRLRTNRKRIKRSAKKIETATVKHAHTFIVSRWENVKNVRKLAMVWLLLVAILISVSGLQMLAYYNSYTRVAAADGGTYAEGVVGPLETINPLFAATSAERSASKLIFSGLLSYDPSNKLRGEIADTWRVENGGLKYVVDLRQNVMWHDGVEVTADDVVFTINRIKNPDVRSRLYEDWVNVTVSKISRYSVAFTIPRPYSPFVHALTFGLIPKHILESVSPESFREAPFNRQPIGTGPFTFSNLQIIDPDENRVVMYMSRNDRYVFGAPKLDQFQLHVYKDSDQIKQAFITNEINAAADVSSSAIAEIYKIKPDTSKLDVSMFNGVFAFLKNDSPYLADIKVREALRLGVDREQLIKKINNQGTRLDGPLLEAHFPSLATKQQPAFNKPAAALALDQAGWVLKDGQRVNKDGQPLKLVVASPKTADYPVLLETIAANWQALGITVERQLVAPETIQQNVLLPRAYDVLIYELAIGIDPDVYAYWHSTQADPRSLNLSNYKSAVADEALESAISRRETDLRQSKYETFVDTWIKDVPAIALYQPSLHYVTKGSSRTLTPGTLVGDSTDRYRSVHLWTTDQQRLFTTP